MLGGTGQKHVNVKGSRERLVLKNDFSPERWVVESCKPIQGGQTQNQVSINHVGVINLPVCERIMVPKRAVALAERAHEP